MRLYVFAGILVLSAVSCSSQQRPKTSSDVIVKNDTNSVEKNKQTGDKELMEFFSDDSRIGVPHRNKIEISNFKKPDDFNVAIVKFYSLDEKNKDWKLKQTFEFEKDAIAKLDAKLKDFNNDGFKDVTYISDVAARGANEIRRLFIYDRKKDELVYIKNSEEFPNLQYNKELKCLDAWRVYGGTATDFLKIEGDILKEFARVENTCVDDGNCERIVTVIDKNGKKKLLRKDKITADDIYERYKNFSPLIPYESDDDEN